MTGYIGVNNLSKKISSMYIGVNSLSKKVNKAYIGVNNNSKLWYPNIDTTDPNTRYESKNIGTWTTSTDVDTFCSTYNHANNYTGLSLGNYVTTHVGSSSYNIYWEIAGFDMEHNQTAADGNVYDNGYGICMIPKNNFSSSIYATSEHNTGYTGSRLRYYLNTQTGTEFSVITALTGSHLVNRNVLFSSKNSYRSSAYAWTTERITAVSIGQYTGTFARHTDKYDDGEANYKLPVFNYESYDFNNEQWVRNIYGKDDGISAYYITSGKSKKISYCYVANYKACRGLIYIR